MSTSLTLGLFTSQIEFKCVVGYLLGSGLESGRRKVEEKRKCLRREKDQPTVLSHALRP